MDPYNYWSAWKLENEFQVSKVSLIMFLHLLDIEDSHKSNIFELAKSFYDLGYCANPTPTLIFRKVSTSSRVSAK